MPRDTLVQLESHAASSPAEMRRGTPLPAHLHNQVRLNWYLTQWCNYSCAYCPVLVFHKKSQDGAVQPHAFDYYPVERWLGLLDQFADKRVHLHMTGGEVFLDRPNFRTLLSGLSQHKNITVCIATNAFWDPAYFEGIDKSRVTLDIGFHPSQTRVDDFIRRIRKIREAGFEVALVNYVMSPENADVFEENFRKLNAEGFFVQVSAMFPTGVYLTRDTRTKQELEILVRHNTPLDLKYKVLNPQVEGQECFYPAMTYYMLWDGRVQVSCMPDFQNVFEQGFPELPRTAVPCPHSECIGCTDMYRALPEERLNEHAIKLFTHQDLANEVAEYRRDVRAYMTPGDLAREVAELCDHFDRLHRESIASMPQVPEGSAPLPLPPGQSLFGYMDAVNGNLFSEGVSAGRIILSGWVASAQYGAPLRELKLRIGGKEIASVREFYRRPDVAVHFGRANWLMSGWRTMVYLPVLPAGEHQVIVEAIDPQGGLHSLPPWPLRITG